MSLWRRSRFGTQVRAFFVLCPQVLTIRVVALCCFSHLFLLFVHGLMTMAVLSSVNSPAVVKFFRVACVYAPNRNPGREEFFGDVCGWVDPYVPTVLRGDLNAVFDRLLDPVG